MDEGGKLDIWGRKFLWAKPNLGQWKALDTAKAIAVALSVSSYRVSKREFGICIQVLTGFLFGQVRFIDKDNGNWG